MALPKTFFLACHASEKNACKLGYTKRGEEDPSLFAVHF